MEVPAPLDAVAGDVHTARVKSPTPSVTSDTSDQNPLVLLIDACTRVDARDKPLPRQAEASTSALPHKYFGTHELGTPTRERKIKRVASTTGSASLPASKRAKGKARARDANSEGSLPLFDKAAITEAAIAAAGRQSNAADAAKSAALAAVIAANAQQAKTPASSELTASFDAVFDHNNTGTLIVAPVRRQADASPGITFASSSRPAPIAHKPPAPPRVPPDQAVPETDERRYPCDQADCQLLFVRLEHARRHASICGKSLRDTKRVPCPVCGTRFTREDNMKIHAKTKHSMEFPPKRERKLDEYT